MEALNAEVHDVACPLCEERQRDVVGSEAGLDAVRCRACGLFYIDPRRTLARKFDANIDLAMVKYGPVFRGEAPHPRDHNYVEHLRNLERHRSPGLLLDVGAHMGFFSRMAVRRGWKVYGVEPNRTKVDLARKMFGLEVFAGFLQDVPFPAHSFDAATMVDVFEHVHEPAAVLEQIHRLLKPDGLLMIKVPNGEYSYWKSRWLRRFGDERICWDVNEHVVHYTRPTLERMLARTGFRAVEWIVPAPIRSRAYDVFDHRAWRSPGYVLSETAKKALYWYGRAQLRLRGNYFSLLPDIEVLAAPA